MAEELQQEMFIDDVYDALKATVKALGGVKVVGYALWKEKGPEKAGDYLRDCLNPNRNEKLSPEQMAYIRREACRNGIHILAAFEMADAGYEAPKAKIIQAELQNIDISIKQLLEKLHERLDERDKLERRAVEAAK